MVLCTRNKAKPLIHIGSQVYLPLMGRAVGFMRVISFPREYLQTFPAFWAVLVSAQLGQLL